MSTTAIRTGTRWPGCPSSAGSESRGKRTVRRSDMARHAQRLPDPLADAICRSLRRIERCHQAILGEADGEAVLWVGEAGGAAGAGVAEGRAPLAHRRQCSAQPVAERFADREAQR